MSQAFIDALKAYKNDEIPVASLLYHNGKIISRSYNRTRELNNPLMHAESIVIDQALNEYSESVLRESVLISTLEPCFMCSGKIIMAKIKEVHFGAMAPKSGAVLSLYRIFDDTRLNHRPIYSYGYMEDKISSLLGSFFLHKRKNFPESSTKIEDGSLYL